MTRPLPGHRRPAHRLVPRYVTTAGPEVEELLGAIGVELDPWQADFLRAAMGRDRAGRWTADEVVELASRQNGKTLPLLGRALWGALRDELVLFSSHQYKTSAEAFLTLKAWAESPEIARHRPKVTISRGSEAIEFPGAGRVVVIARSRVSGRGFSPDTVIADEAFALTDAEMATLKPAMAAQARTHPQIWYASSAPLPESTVLRRLALKGRAGEGERLVYLEWCADADAELDDRRQWAKANPALGRRLTESFTRSELDALDPDDFRRERLGIWARTRS